MIAGASGAASDAELADLLSRGAAELSLPLDPGVVDRLVAFIRLIERWSATYNLTAVRDPRDMATQHVLDCLAAAAALTRRRPAAATRRLLDVGSGAGLPGLVLAMALPGLEVVCVDSVGKKAAFVTQAAATLGARNLSAQHVRVEDLRLGVFDVIASRAFAALETFVAVTRGLLADNGEWMAMKGKPPLEEVGRLTGFDVEVEPVSVPGLAAERCLVWLQPRQ